MAVYDCCREFLSQLMRGGAPPEDFDTSAEGGYSNWVLWFGCKTGDGVEASSTIAVDFFRQMRKFARPYDGRILLPQELMTWHPSNGRGETIQKVKNNLELVHNNWVSVGPKPRDAYGDDSEEELDPIEVTK